MPLAAQHPVVPVGSLSTGYARLPEHFFARLEPTRAPKPRLIQFNRVLAADLGLNLGATDDETLAALFTGNVLLPGAQPIATAYAGHQFGHFVPQLGDGRAILLGEVRDRTGAYRELQLKGSGRTPYSRNGDGRAALGPVMREYLVSEAMHALGVPTTRALAAALSGERIYRDGFVPGAVLTRVAASHIRVGTFQYFAARGDIASTKQLADYVIDRHYSDTRGAERPYVALLQAVCARQAALIASWMQVGFIHGVMNTDNMALSGETIDFGPCAFLDAYDPNTVFSSIDESGRYAYANQPRAAHWNLARFAETLLHFLDPVPERAIDLANEALAQFLPSFERYWLTGMLRKIGVVHVQDGDRELLQALLDGMQRNQADFTLTFRALCDLSQSPGAQSSQRLLFADAGASDAWLQRWRRRLCQESRGQEARAAAMREVNPAFIPRNHRIEQVIAAAIEREDFSPFVELLSVLGAPYEEREAFAAYATAPLPDERVLRTFCGT